MDAIGTLVDPECFAKRRGCKCTPNQDIVYLHHLDVCHQTAGRQQGDKHRSRETKRRQTPDVSITSSLAAPFALGWRSWRFSQSRAAGWALMTVCTVFVR